MYYAVIDETSECANGHVREVKDYFVYTQLTAGRNFYVLAAGLNTQQGCVVSYAYSQSLVSLQSLTSWVSQLDGSHIRLTM